MQRIYASHGCSPGTYDANANENANENDNENANADANANENADANPYENPKAKSNPNGNDVEFQPKKHPQQPKLALPLAHMPGCQTEKNPNRMGQPPPPHSQNSKRTSVFYCPEGCFR